MRLLAALLLAGTAQAEPLRLELPAMRHAPPPAMLPQKEPDRNLRSDAILLLTMRAQQLAEPHGKLPAFVPALSTTCIGGSLRLDF